MNLVRPLPLPDEFALGYEGRVLSWNGWGDRKQAIQRLLEWSGNCGSSLRDVSAVELLARVSGLETSVFVRNHTALPLRRAVTSYSPETKHGSENHIALLWTMALRETRPNAYFCEQCLHEDITSYGSAYWRREHQLPGMFCCSKHGAALSFVDSRKAFQAVPTDFLNRRATVSQPWLASLKGNDAIQRFHAICADLLARFSPLREASVSKIARARACELGLHVGRGVVRHQLLSDVIKQRFDAAWLDSVIPGLRARPAGEYWHAVDAAFLGKQAGVASTVYALAFSVLYEFADEAINSMVGSIPTALEERTAQSSSQGVSDESLGRAYIAARGQHLAVAGRLKISRGKAKWRLEKLGLPSLNCGQPEQLHQTIAMLLKEDKPLSQACRENGLSQQAVAGILQRALTPLESAIERMDSGKERCAKGPRLAPVAPPTQQHQPKRTHSPGREMRRAATIE
jgi:hypothetical protein